VIKPGTEVITSSLGKGGFEEKGGDDSRRTGEGGVEGKISKRGREKGSTYVELLH